jgi:hypothetical protein
MTCRCKKACSAVETAAEEALEQGSNAFTDAVNYITPRAKQAGQHTYDYAKDAAQRVSEGVSPFIQDARDRIVPLVSEAAERMQPTLEHAYETAKDRVEHDVYPVFQDLWTDANENPTVQEASRRGRSAVAALRGDLLLPEPKPVPVKREGGLLGKILTVLGIAAVVGVVVIVIRAVLGSDDDGWSPAEPMRPGHEDEEAAWGDSPFDSDSDVDTSAQESIDEAEEAMVSEGGPLNPEDQSGAGESAQRAEQGYGEGAYVGSEPPEGFIIKGNERSMKYHTPEAAGYDRTNADVWFNSEEAALAAGFIRALR